MSNQRYRRTQDLSGHTSARRARHPKKAAAYFAKESGLSAPSSVSSRWNTQVTAPGWPSRKANSLISSMTRRDEPGRFKKPSAKLQSITQIALNRIHSE